MTYRHLIIIILLSTGFVSSAQVQSDTSSIADASVKPKSKKIFYGEPGKAALYSLIVPGAGQVYNKRIWKVPLVYALEGAAVYLLLDNINAYNKWNSCYVDIVNQVPNTLDCGTVTDEATAFRVRNSARSNRELSYIFLGVAHLLNVVEAFVDRHLINFDTSDDLSSHIPPSHQFEPQVTFLRVKIPLN